MDKNIIYNDWCYQRENCAYVNCKIKACYNVNNEKSGIFCKNHKIDGMVFIKKNVLMNFVMKCQIIM